MNKYTIIASAVAIALGVTGCSETKTPEQYISSAKQLLADEQIDTAVIELKNAVLQTPRNPEIRTLLGAAYIEQAHYLAAEKEIEKAIELGATENLSDELSFVKLKLAKFDEVFSLLDNSPGASDEEYLLLLVYAGVASIQSAEIAQGQDYFSQAISLNEGAIYGQLAKAYLAQTKSDYEKALGIVEEVLASSTENDEALLLKGNLLYGLEQYQNAANIFEQYVKNKPRAVYVKYFQINSLLKANNYEEAEKHVDWLLSKLKDAPLAHQYKAQIEYQKGNYAEAKLSGEKAAQAGSQFLLAKMVAGLSAYQLKDIEQAYAHLRPLEQHISNNHSVKRVLAVVKLELGYTDEAVATLSELSGDGAEDFLQIASSELIASGNVPSALSILEKAEALAPKNASIKARKGLLLIKEGDDNGIAALEGALELDDSLENVETALALEYLAQDKDEKTKEIADRRIASEYSKVAGLLLQGIYYSKQKMHDQAKEVFEQIILLDSENVAALYNLAVYAAKNKQIDKAVEYLQIALTNYPNHKNALTLFVNLHDENQVIEKAIDKLESLVKDHNYPSYTTLALSTAYKSNGDVEKAIKLLEEQISVQNKVVPMYFILLGDCYMELAKISEARFKYQQGLSIYNNDYVLMLREIGTYELEKKYQKAADKTANALTYFSESVRLRILQAHTEFLAKNYDKAKEYLIELNKDKIKHHFVSSLNGYYAFNAKNYDTATEYYYEAYKSSPSRRNTLSLARALNGQGKQMEAAELLETYLSENKDNAIKVLLAELYGRFDTNMAIEVYRALVDEVPNNAVILNNLAWQLYLNKQYQEALKYAEKAIEINPHDKRLDDTYNKIKSNL
ncbi:PEP-CTERM system TPR-repeat protein PrsT [Thalassotalea sp. M1531]|uniref:PEP-CTERM system TPR-repeat protein PrsT n=1 Tax=Thalassotalea algicola TaxID=2716224 RepID=A0A7Y0LBB5_9GAMM|nr:XrtA/PEP-CTERM system TPR-repeat protein PrsT [Thalassotalea algicola]NMP30541.1 PEP-CTERM system TPR-repeat protein PrsT [Thalassotalea algicola]